MSRFNTILKTPTKTTNLAGGQAYIQTPQLELISILLTSFGGDKFYESSSELFIRLRGLIAQCDPLFVAKAIVYARTKFGMRSISHVAASELCKHISGKPWAKAFYQAVIYRPDDMMEILSYHKANGKVSSAMKKGFASAFAKFDAYSLAKYRADDKDYKLVDVVNLVHPKPIEKNAEALAALIKGDLKSFDTWEVELSKAGDAEDKGAFKKEVWARLIKEKKLGYFALLRNLRNIIQQSPESLDDAIELLTNQEVIKKSLVLPFRFVTAYDQIAELTDKPDRKVLAALSKAVDLSLSNVPKFDGDTLVVLDCSGSMSGKPAKIGSLFAAVLMKACNADFMVFSDSAHYKNLNLDDSTITIANSMHFASGGTNFHSIFKTANKRYDRIIILSDMQGWIGGDTPHASFALYKSTTGANPFIYSFDLAGYGTMQLPQQNVFCMAGFSDKTMDIMKYLEADKNAMINEINKISL